MTDFEIRPPAEASALNHQLPLHQGANHGLPQPLFIV